jgi:hypothetical protein
VYLISTVGARRRCKLLSCNLLVLHWRNGAGTSCIILRRGEHGRRSLDRPEDTAQLASTLAARLRNCKHLLTLACCSVLMMYLCVPCSVLFSVRTAAQQIHTRSQQSGQDRPCCQLYSVYDKGCTQGQILSEVFIHSRQTT